MPPELAQLPLDITQRGSAICSYRCRIEGAILTKGVPAMTIRSASRGVPRSTSAPKREMSWREVNEVIISTKQQESPKNIGQRELDRPQLIRSSRRVKTMLSGTVCSDMRVLFP